jgi:hypothetical protein
MQGVYRAVAWQHERHVNFCKNIDVSSAIHMLLKWCMLMEIPNFKWHMFVECKMRL